MLIAENSETTENRKKKKISGGLIQGCGMSCRNPIELKVAGFIPFIVDLMKRQNQTKP